MARSLNLFLKTRAGAAAGVSLWAVMQSVGHRKADTTRRYCPAQSDEVRRAVEVVEANVVNTPPSTPPRRAVSASLPPTVDTAIDPRSIGSRIRAAREAQGLSPADAARAASILLGSIVATNTWLSWETSGLDRVTRIVIVAKVLGVELDRILLGSAS